MTGRNPQPTVVIGAGQAGLEVVRVLRDLVEDEKIEDSFHFIGIDSNSGDLETVQDDVTAIELEKPDALDWNTVVERYPYLTGNMSLQETGAERQRPIGRFKFDGYDTPGFNEYFHQIRDEIRNHFEELSQGLHVDDFLNIFYIHSLGGGTGSGTFPLLTFSLREIADITEAQFNIDVYLSGVGVVPEIQETVASPEGDPRYFANSYASLQDLQQMIGPTSSNPLRLPAVSKFVRQDLDLVEEGELDEELSTRLVNNHFEITATPFNHYFVVGVDEGRIGGETVAGLEHYQEYIDKTIAECVQSLPRFEGSLVDNWMQGQTTGSFGQAELSVPDETVGLYAELKSDRQAVAEAKATNEEQVEDLNEQIRTLENIITDPFDTVPHIVARNNPGTEGESESAEANEPATARERDTEPAADLEGKLEQRIGDRIGRGTTIADEVADEDITSLLDEIEEDYGSNGVMVRRLTIEKLLTDHLDDAKTTIDGNWTNKISQYWQEHSLSSKDAYGGSVPPEKITLEDKATILQRFFDDKIDEAEETLANAGPVEKRTSDTIGIDGPAWNEWKDRLETEREDFSQIHQKHRKIHGLIRHTRTERRQANDRLEAQQDERKGHRAEVQEEIEDQEDRLDELKRQLQNTKAELTNESFTRRLGFLPIQEHRLAELDTETYEQIDSLVDYVDRGLVTEADLRDGIETQVEDSLAWENQIMDFDYSDHSYREPDNQMWILYPKSFGKSEYLDLLPDSNEYGINYNPGLRTPQETEEDTMHLEDPYTIKFMTYGMRGPIGATSYFKRLDKMARGGQLNRMLGGQEDDLNHRHSFAYMEWYDREIKNAFNISDSVELRMPPELDPDRIILEGVEGEVEEIEKYIRTNGLSAYLWQGDTWDQYEGHAGPDAFTGWRDDLEGAGVFYNDLQQVTPSVQEVKEWLNNYQKWEELIELYVQNMIDREGIKIEWTESG